MGAGQTRDQRLDSNVKRLYHATSEEAARAIANGGHLMQPGWTGYAGGGIYFATSRKDARRKSQHGADVMLVCRVRLGRVKDFSHLEHCVSFAIPVRAYQWMGYDSVCITSLNGEEYVAFDSDQVRIIFYERWWTYPRYFLVSVAVCALWYMMRCAGIL
eukprot:TRINITY_DN18022_c0_g1_i1.p2 TRINITY_DN18022_c0_g1~~TRINITY_DN18022_c0_g1_i1.p2  ORF type:complete len:159 (+),score=15.38 TRINITY_DN18022_c0_g1_i1:76-552(+)